MVFVEEHSATAGLTKRNIAQFVEAQGRTRVLRLSAGLAIKRLARTKQVFDIAWADPPFPSWQDGIEALAAAFAQGVIRPNGIACLECPERADLSQLPEELIVKRDLGGGASRLLILSHGQQFASALPRCPGGRSGGQ